MKEKEIVKKDRQNHSGKHLHFCLFDCKGISGSPKKGGAGGKGVWGTYKEDLKELQGEHAD